MTVKAEITLKGGPELVAALLKLGDAVASRLGENAVRAGIRVIAKRARANARWRDRTGRTRASIQVRREITREAGARTAYAGSRYFVARFFEYGTSRMAARPFLRPALDEGGAEAVTKMTENLAAGIERECAKYGRGAG